MPITAFPPAPLPTDTPAEFNTKSFSLVAALADFVSDANTLQTEVNAKESSAQIAASTATTKASEASTSASTASTAASTATTKASEASTSAANAEVSRIQASKLNLGNKSSAPTVDNQGDALLAGSTYYDTTLNKWRVYSGTAWTDGISAVAGVASLNGSTGALTGFTTDSGTSTLTNKTLEAAILTNGYTEEVFAVTGTIPSLSAANGSIQIWTLTANSTPTDGLSSGQSILIGITAVTYAVTWPAGCKWSKVGGSGTAPTLTSTGVNWVVLWKIGSTLNAAFLGTT